MTTMGMGMGRRDHPDTSKMQNNYAVFESEASLRIRVTALPYYRRFYFVHSSIIVAVLVSGMVDNGYHRKYIPVNTNKLYSLLVASQQPTMTSLNEGVTEGCMRAYVNVHSTTIEEDHAAICCSHYDNRTNVDDGDEFRSSLCHPRVPFLGVSPHRLPIALSLTHPVAAWMLPLLPIFIRLSAQLWQLLCLAFSRNETRESASIPRFESISTTLRRLLFYFFLLNFRGWCLYIGANALEDYVILPWLTGQTVISRLRMDPMSDVEHDLDSSNEPNCWYADLLKDHHKAAANGEHSGCYGRSFDFSDHVVLFLAHYLPIFVMETLIYFAFPFWSNVITKKTKIKWGWVRYLISKGLLWDLLHAFLFLYMHVIIFHILNQTVTFFHTPAETIVGFGISLVVQIPVMYLMCSDRSLWIKDYVGLPCFCQQVGSILQKGD